MRLARGVPAATTPEKGETMRVSEAALARLRTVVEDAEEVGELAQAVLKVRAGKWQYPRVFAEAVQVAAMAMRVALEDDASLSVFYAEPSA